MISEGTEAIEAWDYPLDDVSIRTDLRTIPEVIRRIRKGFYTVNFPKAPVWGDQRQSVLIESVLMRLPLAVFYLSENHDGKQEVMDGVQRLVALQRFFENKLALDLDRDELRGKTFGTMTPKLQNRFEGTMLTLHIIDSKIPDRVKMDIFDRINGSGRHSQYPGAVPLCQRS